MNPKRKPRKRAVIIHFQHMLIGSIDGRDMEFVIGGTLRGKVAEAVARELLGPRKP